MTVQTDLSPSLMVPGKAWPVARLRAELAALAPVFILAAAYLLAALALAATLPGDQPLAVFAYAGLWLQAGLGFGFLFLVARTLPGILRERPARPLAALARDIGAELTPPVIAGIALIATQALVMGIFTSVKNMLPDIAAYSWDAPFAGIDAFLAFGADPWRYLDAIVSRPWALAAVEFTYLTGWMLMIGLIPAIVAFSPRFAPIRLRFFLTYILCWIVIGNVLAVAGMSAGPVFFGAVTGDAARFQPLLDHLAANSGWRYSAYDLQQALWRIYESGEMALGSGVSAFPSMHVSMATLWLIVGLAAGRLFAALTGAFLLFVLAASVALGWHYAIDGYVSILVTVLLWLAIGKLLKARLGQTLTSRA